MPFVFDPTTQVYTHTVLVDPKKMPLIVGIPKNDNEAECLLNEGILEVDRMDGSIHDSDGCEKEMTLFVDYDKGIVGLRTFPEDASYWKGTELGERVGMLGWYSYLLDETLSERKMEYCLNASSDFDEVFFWDRSFVLQYHSELLEAKSGVAPNKSMGM